MISIEYYDDDSDCSSYNGKSKWLCDNGDDSGDCDHDCNGCGYFTDCHGQKNIKPLNTFLTNKLL